MTPGPDTLRGAPKTTPNILISGYSLVHAQASVGAIVNRPKNVWRMRATKNSPLRLEGNLGVAHPHLGAWKIYYANHIYD